MKERGIALLTTLLFLILLSLMIIKGLERVQLDQKMVAHLSNRQIAEHAALDALLAGEAWLAQQIEKPSSVNHCDTPPCTIWQANQLGELSTQSESFWNTEAIPVTTTFNKTAQTAHYLIEEWDFIPYELSPDATSLGKGHHYYRITAHGIGRTLHAEGLMQSVYVVSFN